MGTIAGNNLVPVIYGTNGIESFRMNNTLLTTPTTFAAGPQNTSQFVGVGMSANQGPWSRLAPF
jgi:hypothetical protein